MAEPRIDVLMVVYNGAAYVQSSADSILGQSFRDFLLHIVDDGSTDDTPKIIAELAQADARVRTYSKLNGGIVEASNFGFMHCQAEFLARQDADDISYPDRLQRQVDIMDKRLDIVGVSGDAHRIDEHGSRLPANSITPPPEKSDYDFIPATEPYLIHPFAMFRRGAVVQVGGYRSLPVSEDSDLFWRLQEIGGLYTDRAFYGQYRLNSQSISSQSVENGRIMAVCSQLAALSAKRRRSGASDLDFDQGLARELKAGSHSLENACEVMGDQVTPAEREHLRFAAAVKLMEMSEYRPYELQIADYRLISKLCREQEATTSRYNRMLIHRNLSGVAARLAFNGRWADVQALLYPAIVVQFAIKYVGRFLLPKRLHARIRMMLGRDKNVDHAI